MRTMAEVDAWYEAELDRAKLEGKLEGELLQQQAIALNMIRENIPLETIVRITGVTIRQSRRCANEQIQQLRSNNNIDRS